MHRIPPSSFIATGSPSERAAAPISNPCFRLRAGMVSLALVLTFSLSSLALPGDASARDSAVRKAARGVANVSLGALAVPGEIVQTTRERGPFVGLTWGLTKGVAMMVAHEVVGMWELFTCPFETPPGYKPILDPEFPWAYFYDESPRSGR